MSIINIIGLSVLVGVIIGCLINQLLSYKNFTESGILFNKTIDNQKEIITHQTELLDGKTQQIQTQKGIIERKEFIQKHDWDLICKLLSNKKELEIGDFIKYKGILFQTTSLQMNVDLKDNGNNRLELDARQSTNRGKQ